MKKKIKKICKECKTIFYVLPCKKETIFCSRACYIAYKLKNKQLYTKRIKIRCKNCKKIFSILPCYKNKTKFCSLSCASAYNQRNGSWNKGLTKETNKSIKHQSKTLKNSYETGKAKKLLGIFNSSARKEVKEKISKTMLEQETSKGKNNSMYGYKWTFEQRKAQSIKMLGITENEWNGFSMKCKRRCNKLLMREWRLNVFERDNYTCQNPNCPYCHNKVGGQLEAHHIKTWKKFPELRYNINNGITLCKAFHRHTIHNEYIFEKLFMGLIRK